MFLKAGTILPIDSPPLSPGVIRIQDDKIIALGDLSLLNQGPKDEPIVDLSDLILLPGFVNAHCHLELTVLGPLNVPPTEKTPQNDFVNWIKVLVQKKNQLTEEQIINGIRQGIQALLQSGVTALGDHVSFNMPWMEVLNSPLRGRIFGEILGIVPEVCEDIYNHFKQIKVDFQKKESRFTLHLSPHSVHAVHPNTLKKVLLEEAAPLSCHLAESQSEVDYFKSRGGAMMDLIQSRGIAAPHSGDSGLSFLAEQDLPVSKLMIVHGNYLSESDLQLIVENNLSIVHCPGSHHFFQHQEFPLQKYRDKGINIALGTDSISSNDDLNFLNELKLVREKHKNLTPSHLLELATLGGAKALRLEAEIGSLRSGKKADIIGIKTTSQTPEEAVLSAKAVDWMMINGEVIHL